MTGELVRLERVAAADLPALLTGLWRAGREHVQVSIASAPVGQFAEAARTVRPLSVWKTLFDLAGYDVATEDFLADPAPAAGTAWNAAAHWAGISPFREDGDARRRTIGLRRRPAATPDPAWEREMLRTLGVRPASGIPPRALDPEAHLVFLVGTYQEFRQYHPLWSELPADAFTVLLRDGGADAGWTRRRGCMEAWLSLRGITWLAVPDVSRMPWERWPHAHRVLVAGADSNVFRSHVLNAAFVAAARGRGWRTVQLQHGIWPHADATAPMTMMSGLMLTWSGEFKRKLAEVVAWPDGSTAPRGCVEGTRFVTTGSPAFDRYTDAAWPRLEDLLGDWVARYRRRVLVATNLHWSQHRAGAPVNPAILDLARHHDDTLFIVKPHPTHDPDDAFLRACPPNVQVVDEFCCLFADLDSARLVLATDAVICTLSTVALEAAVAGRPFLVLDTGNPNRYEHVTPVAPDRLRSAYAALTEHPPDAQAFVDHYLGPGSVGRATRAVFDAIRSEIARPSVPSLAAEALAAFVPAVSAQGSEAFALEARIAEVESCLHAARAAHAQQAAELTALLAEAREREAWLRGLLRDKDAARSALRPVRVGLFGAAAAGVRWAAALGAEPGVHLHCFFDNDPARWGTIVAGLRVRQPTPAALDEVDLVVVSSVHAEAIGRQVAAAGHGARLVLDPGSLTTATAQAMRAVR
jgi:hypothetical protein